MSWRTRNDLGLELISDLHTALKINDHWVKDLPRGFMWWAEEFAQKIWADLGMFHNAQSVFRLHAETELLRGKGRAADFELALAENMKDALLGALCYDAERDIYVLHSSIYFTHDNAEVYKKLFFGAIALQVDEAHSIGHDLARKINAVPAMSEHPEHGLRSPADPLIGSTERFFVPYGKLQSKWEGSKEWKEVEYAMDRQASAFSSDHHSWCRASFPFQATDAQSELIVTAAEPHPRLGNGLMMQLKIPLELPPERLAHTAMELNNIERHEWLRCQMLGSWGYDGGRLQFEMFIPNTSYHEGLLEALSLSMAVRAQWVNEQFLVWTGARS